MSRAINIIGKRFGRLLVLKRMENASNGDAVWLCKCDCGKTKSIRGNAILTGRTISCGCYHKEIVSNKNNVNYKDGRCGTRLYNIYNNMKSRCYKKNHKSYANYGGRGIKICDEWLNKEKGFVNFYNWAMNNGYRDNLTIDRIDNDGDYKPSNCRWTTYREQANNTRTNHKVKYNGQIYTLAELSRKFDLNYEYLKNKKYREENNILDI